MIIGIGIDIVDIGRFEQPTASETFLKKIFTPREIEECRAGRNAAVRFAKKFALKEAFMKAIGAGIRQEVWFTNVEILAENSEQPRITPTQKAKHYFEQLNADQISISCSANQTVAIGVVILDQ
jgi:holo-[acyl-carrier protein] synthase